MAERTESGAGALVLVGGKRPRLQKPRKGGWTKKKRADFLAALTRTCNIAAALRTVRMSRSGLDGLRSRDAGFRAEMREAIRGAYGALELVVLEQMLNGTVRTIRRRDGSVETVHEYPLALSVQLLRLHKDNGAEPEPLPDGDKEEVIARLLRKIDAAAKREAAKRAGGATEASPEPSA
jgi:hypothetical protein